MIVAFFSMTCWTTCYSCHLVILLLLLSLLFDITTGQSVNCDDLTALAKQNLNSCGSNQPDCSCDTSSDGIYYALCSDPQRICSTLDSTACGFQSHIFYYDNYGKPSKYFIFTYDNGVKVQLKTFLNINLDWCTASIKDAAGTETQCDCNYKNCPDVITLMPWASCSKYESGAFIDGCMENWGAQSGIMLGLASILSGLCVADDSAVVPATDPTTGDSATTDDSAPTAAVPLPSCEDASKYVIDYLDIYEENSCGVQPECSCDSNVDGSNVYNPDGLFYAHCRDKRYMCSTTDSTICGYQSAWEMYDPGSGAYVKRAYEWQYSGTKNERLLFYSYPNETCTFSIFDEDEKETACSCTYLTCTEGDSKGEKSARIDCSNYESGAIANGCTDKWLGVTEGILLGFVISEEICTPRSTSDNFDNNNTELHSINNNTELSTTTSECYSFNTNNLFKIGFMVSLFTFLMSGF